MIAIRLEFGSVFASNFFQFRFGRSLMFLQVPISGNILNACAHESENLVAAYNAGNSSCHILDSCGTCIISIPANNPLTQMTWHPTKPAISCAYNDGTLENI